MPPRRGSSISRDSSSPQNRVVKPPHTRNRNSLQGRRPSGQVVVEEGAARQMTPTLDKDVMMSGSGSGSGSAPQRTLLPSTRPHAPDGPIPIDTHEQRRYSTGAELYRDHFSDYARNQAHHPSANAYIEPNERPPRHLDSNAFQGAGETTTTHTTYPEVPRPRFPRAPYDQAAITRFGPTPDDDIMPTRARPAAGPRYGDPTRRAVSRGRQAGESTTRDAGTMAMYSYPRLDSGRSSLDGTLKDRVEDVERVRRDLVEMEEQLRAATKRRISEVSASLHASPTKESPGEDVITRPAN